MINRYLIQLIALQAMIAVLCCGPSFDESILMEDGTLYSFLDTLLESQDEKVRVLDNKNKHMFYFFKF